MRDSSKTALARTRERAVTQTAQRLAAQFGSAPGLRHARPAYWRLPADRAVAAGWKARQGEVDLRDAEIWRLRHDILFGLAPELPSAALIEHDRRTEIVTTVRAAAVATETCAPHDIQMLDERYAAGYNRAKADICAAILAAPNQEEVPR